MWFLTLIAATSISLLNLQMKNKIQQADRLFLQMTHFSGVPTNACCRSWRRKPNTKSTWYAFDYIFSRSLNFQVINTFLVVVRELQRTGLSRSVPLRLSFFFFICGVVHAFCCVNDATLKEQWDLMTVQYAVNVRLCRQFRFEIISLCLHKEYSLKSIWQLIIDCSVICFWVIPLRLTDRQWRVSVSLSQHNFKM